MGNPSKFSKKIKSVVVGDDLKTQKGHLVLLSVTMLNCMAKGRKCMYLETGRLSWVTHVDLVQSHKSLEAERASRNVGQRYSMRRTPFLCCCFEDGTKECGVL